MWEEEEEEKEMLRPFQGFGATKKGWRKRKNRRLKYLRALRRRPSAPPNSNMGWMEQISASYISKAKFIRREVTCLRETDLEEEVWSKGLPDDIFCKILACLPLSSFFRMRSVCKKWSLIAQDPNFLNAFSRVPSQEPSLFFTSRDGAIWTYEHDLNAWRFIPPCSFYPKNSEGSCSLVTAAGGRLLFMKSSPQYSLMVYNPLNKTQRTLPPMFDMSDGFGLPSASEIHVVGMYLDTVNEYYNILVVDRRTIQVNEDFCENDDDSFDGEDDEDELEAITSQVYDSRTCTWELIDTFNPGHELRMLNAALFADALHCLTLESVQSPTKLSRSDVDELAVYTVSPDGWEEITLRVPTQDQKLVAPHIFSTRGRAMLAAAVPQKGTKTVEWKSIIIWELEMIEKVEEKWVKLTEIDLQGLGPGTFMVSSDSFFFLSEGDSLYFGSNTGSALGVINIRTQSWWLLPQFPGYVSNRGKHKHAKKYQTFLYERQVDLVA